VPINSVSRKKMAKRGAVISATFVVISSVIFYLSYTELAIFVAVCGSYVPSTWDLLDG